MKRIRLIVIGILAMFIMPVFAMAEGKEMVNVHIFKSSACSHCAEALEFFKNLESDSEYGPMFQLVPYETNGNSEEIQNNIKLAEKVAKYFGESFEGVPLIVIGEERFEGYSSMMDEKIKEAIKKTYEHDSVDVVKEIKDGTLKPSNFEAIMTIVIAIVLVGGISYFVYLARKGTSPEEIEENLEEPILEETIKKQTEKKTKSKKTDLKSAQVKNKKSDRK